MRQFSPFTENKTPMMKAVLNNIKKEISYFCHTPTTPAPELSILNLLSDIVTCARCPL